MVEVVPLPHRGEILLDPRGEGRSLRISGHEDAATVVLSIWDRGRCRATFRLPAGQVDALVRAVLAAAPPAAPEIPTVAGAPSVPAASTPTASAPAGTAASPGTPGDGVPGDAPTAEVLPVTGDLDAPPDASEDRAG